MADQCISCGRNDRELFSLPSALDPGLKACGDCILKYGDRQLAHEADRILATWTELDKPRCLNCFEEVLTCDDGRAYMYCSTCYRELKENFKCQLKKLKKNQ